MAVNAANIAAVQTHEAYTRIDVRPPVSGLAARDPCTLQAISYQRVKSRHGSTVTRDRRLCLFCLVIQVLGKCGYATALEAPWISTAR